MPGRFRALLGRSLPAVLPRRRRKNMHRLLLSSYAWSDTMFTPKKEQACDATKWATPTLKNSSPKLLAPTILKTLLRPRCGAVSVSRWAATSHSRLT
ncbi:hypothetical protein [Blackfly microvirus SF02]|uniref:Uncharacterized protein n=1 Tax=Blackfly microvirus SF02 TaxID=2576452 RepID=A0A4P8PK79_9VIRU|nr:hypothetical protein [Blackfly microvirus SF02]